MTLLQLGTWQCHASVGISWYPACTDACQAQNHHMLHAGLCGSILLHACVSWLVELLS